MNNILKKSIANIFILSMAFLSLGSTVNAAALSSLSAATATNTFDSLNFAQTWNWSTASTQNPFSFNFNGLTSGSGLRILSSATGLTGNLASITLSGNNSGNTGNLLLLTQSGASSAAIPLNISNSGTGNSLKITSGTVPFVITSLGKVGVANSSPSALVTLGTAGTTAGTISLAGLTSGTITLQVPSVAGSTTITFPATTGTVITTGDSGTVTNSMLTGSIAASKLIGTDIATVGTVTTGTWNGSTIPVTYGGTGATTLTSHGVLIGNGTGAVNATSAGTAGQVLTSNGSSFDPTFQSPTNNSPMTLLGANSGTSTNTSANNLDTISISGLTGLDTIEIYYTLSAANADGGSTDFRNSTDGVILATTKTGTAITAGLSLIGKVILQQDQSANNIVQVMHLGTSGNFIATGAQLDGNTSPQSPQVGSLTLTTPWTSSWTLALRNAGVTSGGTLHWSWKVYKIAGQ